MEHSRRRVISGLFKITFADQLPYIASFSSGSTRTRKRNNIERPTARQSFAFDYGTTATQHDNAIGQAPEKELTALEEENIFDHLDDLTSRDRDSLDSLGKEFYIKDYYRVLRIAKEEEDERVNQLKVTAVVRLFHCRSRGVTS
jgi:DNA gyrase/topoisomerase IV subunit A